MRGSGGGGRKEEGGNVDQTCNCGTSGIEPEIPLTTEPNWLEHAMSCLLFIVALVPRTLFWHTVDAQ